MRELIPSRSLSKLSKRVKQRKQSRSPAIYGLWVVIIGAIPLLLILRNQSSRPSAANPSNAVPASVVVNTGLASAPPPLPANVVDTNQPGDLPPIDDPAELL